MIEVLYQDEYLVAVNKPAGWLVHRSWLDRKEKIVLLQTVRDQLKQRVFTVHRLDRPTSGVLLMALSSEVARMLAQQFEQQAISKVYHAMVRGYLAGEGSIDHPLVEQLDKIADKFAQADKPAQAALTHYRALAQSELPLAVGRYESARYTLLELFPMSGRKHQLRRHLRHLRHPILGDTSYGDLHQNRALAAHLGYTRLMLHASQLSLIHPVTGKRLVLTAPWDEKWCHTMSVLGWAVQLDTLKVGC